MLFFKAASTSSAVKSGVTRAGNLKEGANGVVSARPRIVFAARASLRPYSLSAPDISA
jgi:hypothetical protein